MNKQHVKYLLGGGGLAGSSAAEAIRELDPAGSMLLVAQESTRPYHRPPLSKEFLRGEKRREELFTLPLPWFDEHKVELRTGRRVSQLDTERRAATLDDGQEISFDRMLIATGGSAQLLAIPGAELPNVFYIRTIDDTQRLSFAVDKALHEGRRHERGRGHAVVIGGGVLGVELAATLTQRGMAVQLVHGHGLWNRFAGESTSQFLSRYLEQHGVHLVAGSRPAALEGDGRVQRVRLSNGPVLECDLAIAAVGMRINRDLLRGTAIRAENAILVDEHAQTNIPGIFAAGDCAAIYDPRFGKHRLMEHWDNAIVTGKLAGRNMAGKNDSYDSTGYFFSDVFELSISVWGEARAVDRRLLRGTPNVDSPDFVEIGIASDGRIAQIASIGHTGEDELLQELVRRRLPINGNEESIKDPRFDLKQLMS